MSVYVSIYVSIYLCIYLCNYVSIFLSDEPAKADTIERRKEFSIEVALYLVGGGRISKQGHLSWTEKQFHCHWKFWETKFYHALVTH